MEGIGGGTVPRNVAGERYLKSGSCFGFPLAIGIGD